MLQILLQMVQPALLRMHRSNSQRRHHHRKLSVCPQCISVLAALQPIYLSTEAEKKEEGGRWRAFPQQQLLLCLSGQQQRASLPLPLLAHPRLEATQPLPPSPCLSSNCTSPRCTCSSKCTHASFSTHPFENIQTHAFAKVRRNTHTHNYTHICKYANSHYSLHKNADVFFRR